MDYSALLVFCIVAICRFPRLFSPKSVKKQGNQISYDYKDLMDAIQDGRIKIKGLTKLSAMEKITNYKKLVELGFEVKKGGILGAGNGASEHSDITITKEGV